MYVFITIIKNFIGVYLLYKIILVSALLYMYFEGRNGFSVGLRLERQERGIQNEARVSDLSV